MKSIEERAKEYATDAFDPHYILPAREGYIVSLQRKAYIAGAKEQRKIDIDKACQWFGEYLMDIGYPDDWMRDSLNTESGEERFIKAMEK